VRGDRDLGSVVLRDRDGQIRSTLQRPDLADLVDTALTQPRRYGAADPELLGRILDLLGELAWRFPTHQHFIVQIQLSRLRATIAAQDFDAAEIRQLHDKASRVERRLLSPASEQARPDDDQVAT
jgi:uncharacterized membrane protein